MRISKKFLTLYFKLKKDEFFVYLVKVIGFIITCFTIFILLFMENLNETLLSNTLGNTVNVSQTQFIYVSNIILNIFSIICIFILTYACINFSNFNNIKNNKRINILKALGISKKQEFMFEFLDILLVSILSSILANILANYTFKYILTNFFNIDVSLQNIGHIFYFFKVLLIMISIQFLVLYLTNNSQNKSIWSNIREQDEDYKMSISKKISIFIWFLFNILMFSQNIYIGILGSIILLMVVYLIYISINFGLNIFINIFSKNSKYNISNLTIKVMKKRNKKNSIFLTIICISILLLYFIINVDWGLERFLEKYWEDTHNYNIGILTDVSKENNIEDALSDENIPYLKVYVKEFTEYIFLVSNVTDDKSPFYVEEGTIRTINYNFYRYNLKEGNNIKLDDKTLKIGKPLKEYGFLLLNYQVLGNYNDFKNVIDESYIPVFLILYENNDTFKKVENISEKNNSEFLSANSFMKTINTVFKDYINLIKFIFIILVCLIFIFIIVSAILSITLRKKEIFTYWAVGGSIKQIKKVILLEYFYLSIIVVIVSSIFFIILFNLFQLIYFSNSTFYNIPLNVMFLATIFTLLLILGIVFMILTNFCRNRSYLMTRED